MKHFAFLLIICVSIFVSGLLKAQVPAKNPAVAPAATAPKPPIVKELFGSLVIDKKAKFTTNIDKRVTLSVTLGRPQPLRYQMMISNSPTFTGSQWEQYVMTKSWFVDGEDGLKTVYVKFKDPAGNESESINSAITLDRTAPVPVSIQIENNAVYATNLSRKVKVAINATGAVEMEVSSVFSFNQKAWKKYATTYEHVLEPSTEGKKFVYVRFKDEAGNISQSIFDTITLDTKPPTNFVLRINNGALLTNAKDKKVSLTLAALGASKMFIAMEGKTPDFKSVEVYATAKDFVLEGEDGEKKIVAYFADDAGNRNSVPAKATITLDRQAPKGGIMVINENIEYCTHLQKMVMLKIVFMDAFQMMISNKANFEAAAWEGVAALKNWKLEGDDGEKIVYIKFRDKAGNESAPVSDKILLDTKPAVLELFVIDKDSAFTTKSDRKVQLTIKATDAEFMIISNQSISAVPLKIGQKPANLEKYVLTKEWILDATLEGQKNVYIVLYDKAGNVSKIFSDKIVLDITPPILTKIIIDDAKPWVVNKEKKVSLRITSDATAAFIMVSNTDKFVNGKWQPYHALIPDWILDGEDGEKSVFIKVKDKAGNISPVGTAKTKMDRKPPTDIKASINNDSVFTRNIEKKVNIKINANDALQMRVSGNRSFVGAAWEPYNALKKFILEGGDGEKYVFVQFKDLAGNLSDTAKAKIILDRIPPIAKTLVINDGVEFTNTKDKKVKLKIAAENAKEMMISSNQQFSSGKWIPYKEVHDYLLEGEDGPKFVYVRFRDESGNISTAISATIKLKVKF